MKRALVTGVAGFIGSNLAERLLDKGFYVYGVDNDIEKKSRIKYLEDNNRFMMFWVDINDLPSKQLNNINIVYHLAASADIMMSAKDLYYDMYNNVRGTHNVLEFIRINNIKKLVFASSSAVYGEGKTPMIEDMPDMRAISLYGASKIAAEAFINVYVDLYNIKASMFRFANVVGKNEHRGVTPDFVKKLKNNPKKLEILGDGEQTKSYFYVDDCINALIKLKPTKPASIYNLGATDIITVTDVANIICDEMGLDNVKYSYTGGDRGWVGDVPKTIMCMDRANSKGWYSKYNCEMSIRKTVRWLLDNFTGSS